MKSFLGIDIGTSSVKAVVISENGEALGSARQEITLITEKPMWAEQSSAEWWEACKHTVQAAVRESGGGEDIAGIGVTGQMLGCVLIDKNLDPIGNSIIWMDQRAAAETEWIKKEIGIERLLTITQNIPLTGHWAPKLIWLKENREEDYERAEYVIFPKDYINLKLTGEITAEVSDASGSYLLDVPKRRWSKELIALCGLSDSMLPERLLESKDIAGYLRPEAATELGLKKGIIVVGGAGDQQACAIGSGVIKEGIISSTIGTSGVVFAATNKPIPDIRGAAAMSYCHAIPDMWCLLGCVLGAGGSFKWLRDTFFAREKTELEERGEEVYEYMASLAEKASASCEGLLFLPYLNGERTPYPDPYAKGVFFGLSYRHTINEIVRSVMEGVTYGLRDTVELIRDAGIDVKQVVASGGGAKSGLWLQMQADIFNSLVVVNNITETGCTGAAILAGIGARYYKSFEEACGVIIKPVSVTEPDLKNTERYQEFYQSYRSLYPILKDTFSRQAELVSKYRQS